MTSPDLPRCGWATSDPLYIAYHDEEWGRPSHDDRHLFEMLILEGAQAGLSWITSSIASEARPSIGTGGEGNCVLWRPNVALAAGDVLRFATFCSVAYTLGPIWGGVVPELIVRDAGPA